MKLKIEEVREKYQLPHFYATITNEYGQIIDTNLFIFKDDVPETDLYNKDKNLKLLIEWGKTRMEAKVEFTPSKKVVYEIQG
jgi:hypothetical protein